MDESIKSKKFVIKAKKPAAPQDAVQQPTPEVVVPEPPPSQPPEQEKPAGPVTDTPSADDAPISPRDEPKTLYGGPVKPIVIAVPSFSASSPETADSPVQPAAPPRETAGIPAASGDELQERQAPVKPLVLSVPTKQAGQSQEENATQPPAAVPPAPQTAAPVPAAVGPKKFTIKAKKVSVAAPAVSADTHSAAQPTEPARESPVSMAPQSAGADEGRASVPDAADQTGQVAGQPAVPEGETADVVGGPEQREKLSLKTTKVPSATPEWGQKERTFNPVPARLAEPGGVDRGKLAAVKFTKKMAKLPAGAQPAATEPKPDAQAPEAAPVPERPATIKGRRRGRRGAERDNAKSAGNGAEVDLDAVRARRTTVKEKGKASTVIMLSLVTVLGVIFTGVIWWLMRGTTAGRFILTEGEVMVYRGDKGKEKMIPAVLRMRIVSDDIIKLGSNSIARIRLTGMQDIKLDSEAWIKVGITKLGTFKKGGHYLNLFTNVLYLEVPPQPPMKDMTITTPDTGIAVHEANFAVAYVSNSTEVVVEEGSVNVTRNFDKMMKTVEGGYKITVSENQLFEIKSITGETRVDSLSLVDAGTGTIIPSFERMPSELILSLSRVSSGILGIQANTLPATVGSVKFVVKKEGLSVIVNEPPYIFKGKENPGIDEGWRPRPGQDYMVEVIAYSRKDGKGKPSMSRTVLFHVIN